GALPSEAVTWPARREDLRRCRAVVDAAGSTDPIRSLTLCATTIGGSSDGEGPAGEGPAEQARRLLAIVPAVLGGSPRGTMASRLARSWARSPSDELERAIDRALVLLADHELATS